MDDIRLEPLPVDQHLDEVGQLGSRLNSQKNGIKDEK
jgi:hypothetical protein